MPTDADGNPVGPVTDADDSHYNGVSPQATIGGTLWNDADGDGIQGPGETVQAGVVVELLDENGDPVLDANGDPITAITDADGTSLTPGNGGDDDVDGNGMTGVISVGAGEDVTGIDAGLVVQATVGGIVWNDIDRDGVQDPGETVRAGVKVELLDENGNPVLDANGDPIVAFTDASGAYLFNVEPGNYRMRMTAPDGTVLTPGNGGDDDVDGNGLTAVVAVGAGENVRGIDAGLVAAPATLAFTGGSVSGPATAGLMMILLGGVALFSIRRRSSGALTD